MIEELIHEHLLGCKELEPYMAVYAGKMAIFTHEAPMDTMTEWGDGSQYGRIVFSIDTSSDPERIFGGKLIVDIFCEKAGQAPEEIEPVLKPLVDGYFFAENEVVVSAKWQSSDYFTAPDENIIGVTMVFDLLAYPLQMFMEPDPVRLVSKWSREELAGRLSVDLHVIGYSDLPEVFKPSVGHPAIYWRNIRTDKCTWIPDTWNCNWQTVTLQCHILTPDMQEAGRIARTISTEFARRECLLFESGSPLYVDRNNRIVMAADPVRAGQLSVEATYGILRTCTSERLEQISVTEKQVKEKERYEAMAKEQKEAAAVKGKQETSVEEKQPKQQEKPGKSSGENAYETKYAVSELAEAAKPLFNTSAVIVRAALKAKGKEEYTEKEAVSIVEEFMKKGVK